MIFVKKINLNNDVYIFYFLTIIFLFSSCNTNTTTNKNEKPIAKVNQSYLYPSDVSSIGRGLPRIDSVKQVKAYINKWVQDQLVMEVAAQNVEISENIERRVKDYRASLLLSYYEQALIRERLDTIFKPTELADYYNNHLEEYMLGQSWIQCLFIKVPKSIENVEDLKKWFKKNEGMDFERIKKFCAENNTTHILDESMWIEYPKLLSELPEEMVENSHLNGDKVLIQSDENYVYLLRVFDYRDKNEASPLQEVQEKIKAKILHQRKQKILDDIRDEIYKKAAESNDFEIY